MDKGGGGGGGGRGKWWVITRALEAQKHGLADEERVVRITKQQQL